MRNWKELKEDTLNGITPEMKEHIMKFSKRTIPPRQQKAIDDTKELSPGAMGFSEFKNIVTKYDKAIESTDIPEKKHFRLPAANTEDQLQLEDTSEHTESSVIRKQLFQDSAPITLDSLRLKIAASAEKNVEISPDDQSIITPPKEITSLHNSNEEIQTESNTFIQIANPNMPVQKKQAEEALVGTPYPDRIRIPRKAYQRGVTYKVNDCYYDDDGRFLYRVPGLEGKFSSNAS